MSTATSTDKPIGDGQSVDRTAAMKTRIISHMNADHADSLSLYLRHFCQVPELKATSPRLSDITLDHMIIESKAGRNIVYFKPPMKTFGDARERTVAMHHEAMRGLGVSDIKVTEYAPPHRVWQWGLFWVCIWCYTTFPFPDKIRPGSGSFMSTGWSFGGQVPQLATLAADLAPLVLPGMLIVHAGETVYMWTSRLKKHGLALNQSATWLWLTNTFVSGFGCIGRFDELIKEKRRAKEAKSNH